MKGIIFTLFQDMLEEHFSIDAWEQLSEHKELASEGIYTSAKVYPDEKMMQLVTKLAEYSGQIATGLLEQFSHYLLPHLMRSLPATINSHNDLWSFLATIDGVINMEVGKLNTDASTPEIKIISYTENSMALSYQSSRKSCSLAIGLIEQVGEHFNSPVIVSHQQCMHDDHDHCVLNVRQREKNA